MVDAATSQIADDVDGFAQALHACHEIKTKYVTPRIHWYETHTEWPRYIYRGVGIATVVLSVTLPALASAQFVHKEVVVSAISVVIAVLTGLSSFYHWERTWRGNSTAQMAIEQAVGKWELELKRAEFVVSQNDRVNHIIKATDDLLANTGTVVSSETEGFFSNLRGPQQNSAGKQ